MAVVFEKMNRLTSLFKNRGRSISSLTTGAGAAAAKHHAGSIISSAAIEAVKTADAFRGTMMADQMRSNRSNASRHAKIYNNLKTISACQIQRLKANILSEFLKRMDLTRSYCAKIITVMIMLARKGPHCGDSMIAEASGRTYLLESTESDGAMVNERMGHQRPERQRRK